MGALASNGFYIRVMDKHSVLGGRSLLCTRVRGFETECEVLKPVIVMGFSLEYQRSWPYAA